MAALLVVSTASQRAEAEKIADVLVKERLAACVTLIPQITSRYWWKGKIESGEEVLLLIKTVSSRFKALEKRIKELHSYETPEILALPVAAGSRDYLRWLHQETFPKKQPRLKQVL
jgi:periplasmic divalent cation tolerance protein